MSLLFRISKDARLKKDILEYLDNQSNPVFFNEMLLAFPQISMSTLQKKCHELNAIIKLSYPENTVQLIINKRTGIKLIRQSDNLEAVMESLIVDALPYQLAKRFVYSTSIDSEKICQELGMSFSQLRRKVNHINSSINRYDLHMTVSHQIKIFGSELMRRANLIFALSSAHRDFSTIQWIENPERYTKQSELILDYLNITKNNGIIHNFKIITFINECSINSHRQIIFHSRLDHLVQNINFPNKPDFLFNWEDNDWYFFILMIYSSNTSNYNLEINPIFKNILAKDSSVIRWFSTFDKYFKELSSEQKDNVLTELIRGYITDELLNIDYIFSDIHSNKTINDIKEHYPVFYKNFSQFWDDILANSPTPVSNYMKFRYLLIFQLVFPLHECIPKIHLYLESSFMLPMKSIIKNRISLFFSGSFDIDFTDEKYTADFIIATSKNYNYKKDDRKKLILLEQYLSENDLSQMHERFASLFE